MIQAIKNSFAAFSKDPVTFMVPTFLYPMLMLITLGAICGVLLIVFFIFTLLGLTGTTSMYVLGGVGVLLGLVYMIMAAGYKGAMVNEYNNATEKGVVGLEHYLKYAFANAGRLFVIAFIKMALIGFVLMPFVLLYYYVLYEYHEAYTVLAALAALAGVFIIEFVFAFSYPAYVVRKVSPITAIIISFNFVKDKHIKALGIYAFYSVVALSTLIPLLDIITYFVFYPIAYTSLLLFFKR